ncbi:unnamed protein product [Prunus brigantina]
MKSAARSLLISVSMIATCSGAKLRLFCTTGLLAGLTWSRWQMMFGSMLGMSDGDHANMSLLFGRKRVSSTFSFRLRREPIRAFLFGWSGSKGTNSTLLCLVDQDRGVPQASSLLQGSLSGGFPHLDPFCLDSGVSRSAPLCQAGQD